MKCLNLIKESKSCT